MSQTWPWAYHTICLSDTYYCQPAYHLSLLLKDAYLGLLDTIIILSVSQASTHLTHKSHMTTMTLFRMAGSFEVSSSLAKAVIHCLARSSFCRHSLP